MLQKLIQAMEEAKNNEILEERLGLREREIKLLEKQNKLISNQLQLSLNIVCNNELTSQTTPMANLSAGNASLNTQKNDDAVFVESIQNAEEGTYILTH